MNYGIVGLLFLLLSGAAWAQSTPPRMSRNEVGAMKYPRTSDLSDADREKLFQEFRMWQQRQSAAR